MNFLSMLSLRGIIAFILFVGFLTPSTDAYVSKTCQATTGEDMGCQCAQTEPGISCPENYYCPEYNVQTAMMYQSVLEGEPNYCQVQYPSGMSNPYIVCPCPPGYFCPTNSSQPTYCCKGFYCPSNGDISQEIVPGTGLGTWGSLAYECPEGKYCQTAQIKPFNCPNLGKCPKGSTEANKTGQWAILIVAIILIFIGFWVLEFRRNRLRKLEKIYFQQENSRSDRTVAGNISDENATNPLATPISGFIYLALFAIVPLLYSLHFYLLSSLF